MHWHEAARFRRVCPLLVQTPQGWRCAAHTADVRPFWGRAAASYGGTIGAHYPTGAHAVFNFLRVVGYPVNIFQVCWPPSWSEVARARGWYFTEQARLAFAANRTGEALLYLSNAYEFDPSNYAAGLTLAKTLQSGQPVPSNRIYERLYREHTALREETAQEWFRAMLARGDFTGVQELARDRLLHGTPHASVWMRALVFATRQLHRDDLLRALRDAGDPAITAWRPLLETEILFQAGRTAEARATLDRADWRGVPAYGAFYQVDQLIAQGDAFAALDRLGKVAPDLDPETRVALGLAAFARQNLGRPYQQQVDQLLNPRLSPAVLKVFAVQLIRHPDPALLDRLYAKLQAEPVAFSTDNAGVYFALLCAAGVQGDWTKFSALGHRISAESGMSASFLVTLENFFHGRTNSDRATSILPLLPLPLEVTYAMIERYPGLPPVSVQLQP